MKPLFFFSAIGLAAAFSGMLISSVAAVFKSNNILLLSTDVSQPELGDNVLLEERSLPNAPNGYTPTEVECPSSRPSVRSAAKLSSHETEWLKERRKKTLAAMKDFFGHVKVNDFDAVSYLEKVAQNVDNVPNIGIAVSGGGYRALMNGAGAIKAFDSRTDNSTSTGHLGGLLQSANYVSGLSGGGWLLGSLYMNNFTSVSSLQTEKEGSPWQFEHSILKGPDGSGPLMISTLKYIEQIRDAVKDKKEAGYPTTITDYWYVMLHDPNSSCNLNDTQILTVLSW